MRIAQPTPEEHWNKLYGKPSGQGYARPACSHCFGRGFIYVGNALQLGPEAQEESPTEPCPKCNPATILRCMVRKLIDDGWREYPDGPRKYARCFYKRFDTPTRCRCNNDKAGMQVCCAVRQAPSPGVAST